MSYVRRQLVVQGDAVLMIAGMLKATAGVFAAIACGAWLYGWMCGVFLVAAYVLRRGMYWPTLLALIGAAYADWPAREAWGVELSSYPLLAVQALIAVPLWLAVLDYPEKLKGRAKSAAWACCVTALVAGLAAPFLPSGAYWLVVAPLALVAVLVLGYRMRVARVPWGTRGWISCAAIAPMAVTITVQVLFPESVPFFLSTVPHFNVWLSLGPLALIVLNTRRPRHDGQGGKRVARLGMGAGSDRSRPGHHLLGWMPGVVRHVLPVVGATALGGPAAVPSGQAQLQAQAQVHGRVRAWDERRIGGTARLGSAEDDGLVGRHDLLRPAAAEVELELVGAPDLVRERAS